MANTRNAPCACGSGRKSKHCCDAPPPAAMRQPDPIVRMNADHRDELFRHAKRRFGPRWLESLPVPADTSAMDERLAGFWLEWVLHHAPAPDVSVARDYLLHAPRVMHREWLEARLASPLSVHEAVEIHPGEGLTLRDLLTGEVNTVRDVMASHSMLPRECLLVCVVPYEGRAEVTLPHPFKLPASAAADIVAALRRHLRTRKKVLPRERLLDPIVMQGLILEWSAMVDRLLRAPAPRLTNTDGDAVLMTTDHFDVTGDVAETTRRIVALEGAGEDRVTREGDEVLVTIVRRSRSESLPGDAVIGTVTIAGRRMLVTTNSVARADALRARVEQACGALVRHRAREHSDPTGTAARGGGKARLPRPTADQAAALRQFREDHLARWCDLPVPALGGLTPRAAAQGPPRARRALDVLLAEIETAEARLDPSERIDLGALRKSLGRDVEKPAAPRAEAAPRDPWPSLLGAVNVMREVAPWDWMGNADVIAVVDDVTGATVHAAFLGAGGEHFGFLAFDGSEGWSSFIDIVRESSDPLDVPFSQHGMSIWLGDRSDLAPSMREILARAQFRPRGRGSWPDVLVHRPGLVPRLPDDDEAGLLARVLPRALVLTDRWRVAPPGAGEMLVSRGSTITVEPWPAVTRVEEPAPPPDPMTLARAVKAGRIPSTWHLDHWHLPTAIEDREPPWYPQQVLVVDSPSGMVLGFDLLDPDAHAAAGARDLALRLMAELGRPRRIVARRKAVAAALAPLAPHVGIVHDPDPSPWEDLRESMAEALMRAPPKPRGAPRGRRPKK